MGRGLKLRDENRGALEIKQVLNSDDTIWVEDIRGHLQHIVSNFERACDSMGFKINVGKIKVLMVKNDHTENCEKVRVSREKMQEVDNYLEVVISKDGGMRKEVAHRGLEGRKVWWKLANLWKENRISREVKQELYGRVVIPTVVYGSETWSLSEQERRNIEVFEMMCLRNICGLRKMDRVRNAIKREKFGCELSVKERIERKMLK